MQTQLKRDKDTFLASEKVKREKWEADQLKEMRTAAFQQMEPALQGLLDKNKEEVRRAFEEADQRVEAVRSKGM